MLLLSDIPSDLSQVPNVRLGEMHREVCDLRHHAARRRNEQALDRLIEVERKINNEIVDRVMGYEPGPSIDDYALQAAE